MRDKNHASYLRAIFRTKDLISRAEIGLAPIRNDFDAFVGTGISGAAVVPLLAHKFGKEFAIVRKYRDGSHSPYTIECGFQGDVRWLFVDDFIQSGETARRASKAMYDKFPYSTCVGGWLYHEGVTVAGTLYREGLLVEAMNVIDGLASYW